jgi:hypothetical protein
MNLGGKKAKVPLCDLELVLGLAKVRSKEMRREATDCEEGETRCRNLKPAHNRAWKVDLYCCHLTALQRSSSSYAKCAIVPVPKRIIRGRQEGRSESRPAQRVDVDARASERFTLSLRLFKQLNKRCLSSCPGYRKSERGTKRAERLLRETAYFENFQNLPKCFFTS